MTIDSKEGLLSGKGECIIPCQYDKIGYLTEEWYGTRILYSAIKDRKISIWNEEGHCLEKDLDECIFIGRDSNGENENYRMWDVFWVKKDGIGAIIKGDQFDGHIPILCNRHALGSIYDSYKEGSYNRHVDSVIAIVEKGGCFGVTDVMGRVLIDFVYEDLCLIGEDIFKAKKGNKYGIVSFEKDIVALKYDNIVPIRNTYIGTIDGNKYLLDENGNLLISNYNYDDVKVYNGNNRVVGAAVKSGKLWGFVNREGEVIIPCKYDDIYPCVDNGEIVAYIITIEGKVGAINPKLDVLVSCIYDFMFFEKTEKNNFLCYNTIDAQVVSSRKAMLLNTLEEIQLKSIRPYDCVKELKELGY